MDAVSLRAADFYGACTCLGLNRVARITARRYDEALRPLGITSGQFSILSSLLSDAPGTIGGIAALLGMERTTLKRNLQPLEAAGLVRTYPDADDRRYLRVEATPKGRDLLVEAVPLWRRAQDESDRRLGDVAWSDLRPALAGLV